MRYAPSFAAVGCPRFPHPQRVPFPASVLEQRIQPRGVPLRATVRASAHTVCAQLRRSRLPPLSASAARPVPCLGGRTANSAARRSACGMRPASPQSAVRTFRVRSASRSLPRWSNSAVQPRNVTHAVCAQLRRSRCPRFPRPQRVPFPASVAEQRIQPRGVPHTVCAQLRRSRLSPLSASTMLSVFRLGAGAAALTPAFSRGFCFS